MDEGVLTERLEKLLKGIILRYLHSGEFSVPFIGSSIDKEVADL